MVGTRGTLMNACTHGNGNHDTNAGVDDQTKELIRQLIETSMAARIFKFSGVDLKNWLYRSQQFFSVEHVGDADKVKLASIHFYDSALVWHQQFEKLNGDSVSWEDYKKALLARFDIEFEDPLSELKNLKCDSIVQKYHERFELLLNKVDLPEVHAISLFLRGMPQSISLPVRMFKPKSLSDTASLCKTQITTLALPAPKPSTVNPARKYFSQKEFDDKRAKGLCFHCDQKFVPRHKCSGQAFALELIIDHDPQMEMYSLEGNKEEFVMPEVSNEEIPQISLNALTGLTSYRTMRVIGHFGKQKIHILIDSRSTHNFLDVFMAKKLGCKIREIDPLVATWRKFHNEGRQVALRGTIKSPMQWFSGKFEDVFALPTILPPQRHHDHRIPLKEGATPVNIRPYKHPPSQKDAIESKVQELLDSKVIRPSNSPFSSPIVMVKKKDGTWRMCIDYRQLNKLAIKDNFPIPLIEELIDELHGSKVFSKSDLRSGYHQIRMNEKDIPKTTFRTHEDHLQHLRSILTVMRKNSLYAKQSKCVFGTAQVEYLGHVISDQGVATDPAKVTAMIDWPIPTNIKQLRGFIGLTGYYRRFIKNYLVIAQPLTALLKKNTFQWPEQATQSFQALKTTMVQALVLKLPNFDEPFVVETDASGIRIRAVLQKGGQS
ncbi:reverse transcriptase [Tanacetum coccineum]